MIELVVFDLDDTLYPEEEFVLSGFKVVSDHIKSKYGYNNDFNELFVKLYENGVRGDTFNRALSMAGVEYNDRFIEELVEIYRNHRPDIGLYGDVKEILQELSDRFTLGLITDGYSNSQRNKVQRLAIAEYFDKMILTDEFGRQAWKPSEIAFKAMMEHFKIAGEGCVYVADNPHKDFLAPKNLGWLTVRVIRENGQHREVRTTQKFEAHNMISSLWELPSLLADVDDTGGDSG